MASVTVWGLGLVLNPFILWVLFVLVAIMNEDILLAGIWHLRNRIGSTMSERVQEGNLASLVSPVSHLLSTTVMSVLVLSPPGPAAGGKSTWLEIVLEQSLTGGKEHSLPSCDHLPKEGQIPTWVRKLVCKGDRLTKALTGSTRKWRGEMLLHGDGKDKEGGGDRFKGQNLS